MKFSIITPSYNQGRFIRDCIESVRIQAGIEVEHIVVDACSTDETLGILKEYPHLQWTSEPDKGQADAINKGFRRATGDWLMWLNADDYLLPDALAKVRAFVPVHPDADVIFGDCDFVDAAGRLLRHKREFGFNLNMLHFYGCYIPSTATFLQRGLIERNLLLDVNYRICMDFEYYLRLALAGARFKHLTAPLACFRWHDANASAIQGQRRRVERLTIQRYYLNARRLSWLKGELTLDAIFQAYRIQRALRRMVTRLARLE